MRSRIAAAIGAVLVAALAVIAIASASPGADSPEGSEEDLKTAAAAATPSEGDPIPACPDEDTVQKLKAASIPVGPCMPFVDGTTPEEKAEALKSLGDYRHSEKSEEVPQSDCYGGYHSSIDTRSGPIEVEIPCGSKVSEPANLGEAIEVVDGAPCIVLEVRPEAEKSEQRRICGTDDPDGEPISAEETP